VREFPTLDALADEYKPGEILRCNVSGHSHIVQVVGYVYSIPLETGGPPEPALVVTSKTGVGNVYPHEVTMRHEKEDR
jgi:hypothetical protein